MKMYELVEAYQNIMDLDLEEQDLQAVLTSLEGTIEEKAENLVKVMNQLKAEEIAYNDEIKRLSNKKGSVNKKHDNLKEYLSTSLQAMNIGKLKAGLSDISFRKSESASIDDEKLIPKDYIKTKTTESVDKTAIKKAIKAGEEVPGASITVKQNIQIK